MTKALLYQPRSRWRIGAAFGAATLIHFAAVGLAGIHQHKQIDEAPLVQSGLVETDLEPASIPDIPARPPEMDPPLLMPNPTDNTFHDDKPSPAPLRRQLTRPVAHLQRERTGPPGSLTQSNAKALALTAPRPEYPYEARRQRITGNGIVLMTIDPMTGSVLGVSMWQSTGSPCLDNAALAGFRRWRFKPGTSVSIKAPITFTMTGAQY